MIVVKLKGGLGNQLFQYAAAKQLSVKHETPLKLDLSFLEADASGYTKRDFELDKFKINIEMATFEEIEALRKKNLKNFLQRTQQRERKFGLFKTNLKIKNDCYLNGYWQSENYFEDIKEIIREEFVFKEILTGVYFTELQEKITTSNSISLHFRRGDYITDEKANGYFGVCPLEYYQSAVRLISARIHDPELFIFSDDIPWVKSHFHTQCPVTFVEHTDNSLHSDFRLMSMCKHNIIANSSYSWWAAWLNPNKEKVVIAPQKWYENKRKQRQARDRIPKEWLKI